MLYFRTIGGKVVKRTLLAGLCVLALGTILQAQTVTAVYGEAGTNSGLCPGGIAFIQGTGLGGTNSVVTVGTKQAYVFNAFSGTLQVELSVDAPLGATTLKVGNGASTGNSP